MVITEKLLQDIEYEADQALVAASIPQRQNDKAIAEYQRQIADLQARIEDCHLRIARLESLKPDLQHRYDVADKKWMKVHEQTNALREQIKETVEA